MCIRDSNAGGSAYVYRFDRMREGFDAIGAYHGAELPYVFDTHDAWLPTSDVDLRITEALVTYWLGFLSDGRPIDSSSTSRNPVQPTGAEVAAEHGVTRGAEDAAEDTVEGAVEGTVEDALEVGVVGGAEAEAREKVLWPAWSQNQQSLVVSNEVTAVTHPDAELCDFLSAIQATSARH